MDENIIVLLIYVILNLVINNLNFMSNFSVLLKI